MEFPKRYGENIGSEYHASPETNVLPQGYVNYDVRDRETAWGICANMTVMDSAVTTLPLRHTLATLAYRAKRAVEDAPPEFAAFGCCPNPKTPVQILAHMGDLMDWAVSLVEGNQKWNNAEPLPWDEEVARFFRSLELLDQRVATTALEAKTVNRLFQGPIADALTHTGQIAMLRRMAGCPIRGENYFVAPVEVGRAGFDQAVARAPF